MEIPTQLIKDAAAGNAVSINELREALTPENYSLAALDAVLVNLHRDILPEHGSECSKATWSRGMSALQCVAVCLRLSKHSPLKAASAQKSLDQFDDIIAWSRLVFYNHLISPMTPADNVVETISRTVSALMISDLDEGGYIAQASQLAHALVLDMWAYYDLADLTPGSEWDFTMTTMLVMEQCLHHDNRSPFFEFVLSSPTFLKRLCVGLISRIQFLPELSTNQTLFNDKMYLFQCYRTSLSRMTAHAAVNPTILARLTKHGIIETWVQSIVALHKVVTPEEVYEMLITVLSVIKHGGQHAVKPFIIAVDAGLLHVLAHVTRCALPRMAKASSDELFDALRGYQYYPVAIDVLEQGLGALAKSTVTGMKLEDHGTFLFTEWLQGIATHSSLLASKMLSATRLKRGYHGCDNDHAGAVHDHSSNVLNVCGGCRSTYYCSAHCQQHDWSSRHRKECPTARQSQLARRRRGVHYTNQMRDFHLIVAAHEFNRGIVQSKINSHPPTDFLTILGAGGNGTQPGATSVQLSSYLKSTLNISSADCPVMQARSEDVARTFVANENPRRRLLEIVFAWNFDDNVRILAEMERKQTYQGATWVIARHAIRHEKYNLTRQRLDAERGHSDA